MAAGHHFKGFARAHFMSQQGIPTVEDMGDGTHLMGAQGDLRVHALKADMLSIVFAGPDGVEYLIVDGAQPLPAVDVFPYPFGKLLLDQFLPVLGDGGFLFVEHRLFVAVLILDIVEHPHVFLIQRLLQDVVGAHTLGAVGGVGLDIGPVKVFLRDGPLPVASERRIFIRAPGLPGRG